jgi:hypothetical protein
MKRISAHSAAVNRCLVSPRHNVTLTLTTDQKQPIQEAIGNQQRQHLQPKPTPVLPCIEVLFAHFKTSEAPRRMETGPTL